MDKVVLETFEPDGSCFNPPPANSQQDSCKVTVNFHNREDLRAPQPTLTFQREKDHYVLNPSMSPSTFAVLHGLGFNEKNDAVQGSLHFSVFLNKIHKTFYPSFQRTSKYNGPDLLPLTGRMDDFIVSGEIGTPDEKQRKTTAELLRSLLPYRDPEQDWFTRPLKMLLNEPISEGEKPFEEAMSVPVPIRPRLQWVRDQFKVHDELRNVFSAVQDPALKKKGEALALASLIYVNTGEGDLKALQADMDRLAPALRSADPKNMDDPYGSLLKGFAGYGRHAFFSQNTEAARRLGTWNAGLKEASDQHRAELLTLDVPSAFRGFLGFELQNPVVRTQALQRVQGELDATGFTGPRIEGVLSDAASALLPHFTLVAEPGKTPRVKVDVSALSASVEKTLQAHSTDRREYQVAFLALLRHWLGMGFTESKIKGWVQDRPATVELDLSAEGRKNLNALSLRLQGNITKKPSLVLPIVEGVLGAGGIGLTIAGHLDQGNTRTPLNVIGPGLTGFGAGALVCHVFWKSSMPLLTDGICGLAGAALGVTLGAVTTQDPMPPPDPMAARNPNTIGGSGQCKPPNGGCGP